MTNDIIDLTGSALATDNYVNDINFNSGTGELIFKWVDSTIMPDEIINLSGLATTNDKHLVSAALDSTTHILTLTVEDGTGWSMPITVDLSGISRDTHLASTRLVRDTLLFVMSDGTIMQEDLSKR